MGWREQQTEATRERILETFRDLSAMPDRSRVTVAEVSRASGISPATIYRHFPNRDELVAAASIDRSGLGADPDAAWTLDTHHAHLVALWSALAENVAVAREGAYSEAGRELRQARFEWFREGLRAGVTVAGADPDAPDAARFVHALALLSSVHAFLDLHDRQRLSPADAADLVDWAIRILARAAGIDPDGFSVPDPSASTKEDDRHDDHR